MAWSASIRVVDGNGDPVSGVSVTLNFSLMSGIGTEYTGRDEWAEFEYESIDKTSMWVNDVYVDGERPAADVGAA
jgi:phosphoribosylaminoimidazole (AIR) synthetase